MSQHLDLRRSPLAALGSRRTWSLHLLAQAIAFLVAIVAAFKVARIANCLHIVVVVHNFAIHRIEVATTSITAVEEVAAIGTAVVEEEAIPTVAIGEELTVFWEVLLLRLQIYLSYQRHREDDTS